MSNSTCHILKSLTQCIFFIFQPSDCLIQGKISDVECVLLARYINFLNVPFFFIVVVMHDVQFSKIFFRHGRKHTIMPTNVNYRANIYALKEMGCTHVIVTNACGSLKEEIKPGEIIFPDQFIDR